jgi:predicted transcriptional regulator
MTSVPVGQKERHVCVVLLATKGQHVGYLRVSSLDQNEVCKLDGLALDKTFTVVPPVEGHQPCGVCRVLSVAGMPWTSR